jgi:hypothetical protein
MPDKAVIPDVQDLAAQLKAIAEPLIRVLESREEEACRLQRLAEDSGVIEAEFAARRYRDATRALLESAYDARSSLLYMLGEVDADGELYFFPGTGRYRLPGVSGRVDDYWEFTCGNSIEVFCTGECCHSLPGEWHEDRVEHSDHLGGYYLYRHEIPLSPGMRARHRCKNSWDG